MSRRRRPSKRAVMGLGAAAVVLVLGVTASYSGFAAAVSGGSAPYGAGGLVLSAEANDSSCASSGTTISADTNSNCLGTLFPTALAGGSASAAATISNLGSLDASDAQLRGGSCGVLAAPDASGAGDNDGLLVAGVQAAVTAPFSDGSALAFDGTSGYLRTQTEYDNPQTYSVAAWFNTASGSSAGGGIIGFSSAQGVTGEVDSDRMLWVDSAGNVVFGVDGSAPEVISSPGTYADGAWHLAVATASASGTTLYVDGTDVASSSSDTASQSYSGWWHIGYADTSGSWSSPPNQSYFNGDLADVAVFSTALSSAAVQALYAAATQAAESSAILGDSPASYWPLTSISTLAGPQAGTLSTAEVSAGNDASVAGHVTAVTASPFSSGGSLAFDGSSGYLETAAPQTASALFSVAAWFKAPAGGTGTIIGFSDSASDAYLDNEDRAVWLDSTGNVVFGVDSGGQQELTSSSAYTDGSWHFVVASVSSTGMALYVDGSLVASNASVTSATSYTGWWHIGWGAEAAAGWSDAPTSAFFDGDLSNVAVFGSALSSSQVSSLYGQGTQTAEQSAMLAAAPAYYWPLVSDAAQQYCGLVDLTVADDTSGSAGCLLPAQSGSCPALAPSTLLSALASTTVSLPTIPGAGADKITISAGDRSAQAGGLHFSLPLTLSGSNGAFTGTLSYPALTPAQTFTG